MFLSGCTGDDDPGGSPDAVEDAAPAAQVSLAVADGSVDVSPVVPLEIAVTDGELGEGDRRRRRGVPRWPGPSPTADRGNRAVWTPETPLAYGTSYTLTATAANPDDEEASASSTFTTVSPAAVSTPSIGPLDGMTVGVGMPIRVYFDDPVVDKAAVESHLLVTSSTPTDGVVELDQRHRGALPAVAVLAAQQPRSPSTPTSTASTSARASGARRTGRCPSPSGRSTCPSSTPPPSTMQVYDGDQLVQTYPISAGSPDNPSYNGAHVVTELNRDRIMDSSTYGVPVDSPEGYRTPVEYAVRISDSGEFVHAAPWSVAQQGNTNVSHGCINMSTERAAWFFNFSQVGDVVEIRNSCRRRPALGHLRLGHPVGPVAGRQRPEVTARLRPGVSRSAP